MLRCRFRHQFFSQWFRFVFVRLVNIRFNFRSFFAILQFQEHVTALPWPHEAPPDADDVIFLEVALQTSLRTLVTGNLKHFPPNCHGPVTVRSPRDAWEHFRRLSFA